MYHCLFTNKKKKKTGESCLWFLTPFYDVMVVLLFCSSIFTVTGIVKFPVVIKCMYADYQKELDMKLIEGAKDRQLRKSSPAKE